MLPRATWRLLPLLSMEGDGFEEFKEPERESGESYSDHWNKTDRLKDALKIIQPEPGEFKPPDERFREIYGDYWPEKRRNNRPVDLREEFEKLQIIVKFANICLTPEKPTYGGGSWHVEGQLNERMQVVQWPSRCCMS